MILSKTGRINPDYLNLGAGNGGVQAKNIIWQKRKMV